MLCAVHATYNTLAVMRQPLCVTHTRGSLSQPSAGPLLMQTVPHNHHGVDMMTHPLFEHDHHQQHQQVDHHTCRQPACVSCYAPTRRSYCCAAHGSGSSNSNNSNTLQHRHTHIYTHQQPPRCSAGRPRDGGPLLCCFLFFFDNQACQHAADVKMQRQHLCNLLYFCDSAVAAEACTCTKTSPGADDGTVHMMAIKHHAAHLYPTPTIHRTTKTCSSCCQGQKPAAPLGVL